MKRIILPLFLICIFSSCKKVFHHKLTDYEGHYEKSFNLNKNAHLLPKCWNGWFELRIKRTTKIVDGIEIRVFDLDPDLDLIRNPDPISMQFFSYIAFIDDHRLVFYTPTRKKTSSPKETFKLYDIEQSSFQRGYYNYIHPKDTSEVGLLEILLEKRTKKRIWEPAKKEKKQRKRAQKRFTNLTFEVIYKKDSIENFEVSCLKLLKLKDIDDTQIEKNTPGNSREYIAEEIFSFQPTYYFETRRKLELIVKPKTVDQTIDSIFLDLVARERFYYFEEELQFKEILKDESIGIPAKDTLSTW